MTLTATAPPTTSQHLLFINTTKPHLHQIQTLTISKPSKPFPSLISKKPHLHKPHASLHPASSPFFFAADPIRQTLSHSSDTLLKTISKETLANALAITLTLWKHLTVKFTESLANALAVTLEAWKHLTPISVKEGISNALASALAVWKQLTLKFTLNMTLAAWKQLTVNSVKESLASALANILAAWKHLTVKLSPETLKGWVAVMAARVATLSMHEFKEPLVQVAIQAGKWVELYHSVLIVRILLGWFPNMPWEKQPFSAMRDLCDPFLGFCRTIWPPVGPREASIDMSPLVAMLFLGVVSSLLKGGSSLSLPF